VYSLWKAAMFNTTRLIYLISINRSSTLPYKVHFFLTLVARQWDAYRPCEITLSIRFREICGRFATIIPHWAVCLYPLDSPILSVSVQCWSNTLYQTV